MAGLPDINTNEPEVVFKDRDGNYAVVIEAVPPETSPRWRLGDWEMKFVKSDLHMSLMGLSGEQYVTDQNDFKEFPSGPVKNEWKIGIQSAIFRRAMYLMTKHFNISTGNLQASVDSGANGLNGPADATKSYETLFEGFSLSNPDASVTIILAPSWDQPKYISRPDEPAPYRWVVTFERAMMDALIPDVTQGPVGPMPLLESFEGKNLESSSTNMRAGKRFRQRFGNVSEFETSIDILVENLNIYQDEIEDSIWYYTYPGEQEEPPEVDLKFLAALIKDAGIKITDYLYSVGHNGFTSFEIGFQEFIERDMHGAPGRPDPSYGLTGKVVDQVKLQGIGPGIRYIGTPAGGDKAGVKIYHLDNQSKSINIMEVVPAPDVSVGLNTLDDSELDGPESIFNKSPFDDNRLRFLLANLNQIIENDLVNSIIRIPTKEEAALAGTMMAAQALQNPCGEISSLSASKKKTPVDDFVKKRLCPMPESNFRKQSILDFANKLAGFDLSFKSLKDIDVEFSLTKSDILEELMEERNTNLNDYVADMVWDQLPASPTKIRSLDDAWKYILAKIDIPTLIAKYLACLGLDVNLNDLIEWICDEMIRTVDQKTDGGLTAIIEYLESGEFVPGGEYIDLSITEVLGELKAAIAGSVNTGMPAGDAFLMEASFNTKKLICAALIAGPFAAVGALVWLIMQITSMFTGEQDSVPPKKKCDITFDWPDAMPLLETLWDLALKYAEKKLEEEAMKWLEEEIITPLKDWVYQILEICGNEDEFEYGSLPPQLIAPAGLEEVVAPYFMGEEGASDFLEKLLAALTPSEICLLLSKNKVYDDPKLMKVLNFIMKFTKNPANGAPASAIGTPKAPGRLGSPANIVAFFNSIRPRLNTSICDRLDIIPNRQVSDLCNDLAISPKEASLMASLTAQGLSDEDIETQMAQHRESKKKLVLDAIKTLANTGNLSEKLKEDSKKQMNKSVSKALQASAGITLASFFAGIPEMTKSDINTFALILSNAPFIKRMTADLDTFIDQSIMYISTPPSGQPTRSKFHNFKFTIQSAEYLEAKAKEVALTNADSTTICDEWRRHKALMESFQEAMEQDLIESVGRYWDYTAAEDIHVSATNLQVHVGDIWKTYKGAAKHHKWWILHHMRLRHPHQNLIAKYKRLTPEEFDDLAVIAFRYYTRFSHDYTNLQENRESKIQLTATGVPYGSFHYDPLEESGGPAAWWGYLGNVNFRYGVKHYDGYWPWLGNPPGPDPEEKALSLYKLIQALHAKQDLNKGKYKIYKAGVTLAAHSQNAGLAYAQGSWAKLKRFGHWVPINPTWSLADIKTALVQLLLFTWDLGEDEDVDFPIFHRTVQNLASGAWKKNFYGGHLMHALRYYDWGLDYVPGYPGPGVGPIVGAEEGGDVNLVKGKWVGTDLDDQPWGFYKGYVPEVGYTFDSEGNIVPPEILTVNAASWAAGISPSGITATEQLGHSEDTDFGTVQLVILDPETGIRAAYIPLPKPSPWNMFCKPAQPVAEQPELPDKNPTYQIAYGLRPQNIEYDEKNKCMTDRYSFYIQKYDATGGSTSLVSYGNPKPIKLLDNLVPEKPFYSPEKANTVLSAHGYDFSWTKLRDANQPASPQVFTDLLYDKIIEIPKDHRTGTPGPGVDSGLWKSWSPMAMFHDLFKTGIAGEQNLYGVIFENLLKNMSEATVKYGIGMSLPGTDFSDRVEKIISGVRELIPRFFGSGGGGLLDVTDIRNDAIKKHKDALEKADFTEKFGFPALGKSLLSFPERDPLRFLGKTLEEIRELREKEKEDTYPALLRILVRTFVVEKLLKSYLVCGAYNVKKIGSEEIMKEFIFAFIKEAGVEEEIGEVMKVKANEAQGVKDEISFEEIIKPIIEEEVKIVAEKIADLYKPNIGAPDGAIENLFTLPKIYDLASVSARSSPTVSTPPRPHTLPEFSTELFQSGLRANIANSLFTKFRFYDFDHNQLDSGFVLEKYIKVRWKPDLRKSPIGNQEFYNAWKKWPIEFRGYSNTSATDGEKLPVYLSVEDFYEQYTDFFRDFDYSPEEKTDSVSVSSWAHLGNTKTDFYEKLDDLHNKVHSTRQKQGPGDVVGSSVWTKDNFNTSGLSISRSAEIQRHIALMERLLSRFLKHWGHPDKQGYKRAHKEFLHEHGLPEEVDGTSFNSNNHDNAIMPGTDQRGHGLGNYRGSFTSADRECDDEGLKTAIGAGEGGCLIANDQQAERAATYGSKNDTWWTNVKSDLIRWEGDDTMSDLDKRDLKVIAFRFYSRYWLGDFRAFTVDPIVDDIPGFGGNKYSFFKRKGFLDRSCNPRSGLRAPGPMYYHSWETFDVAGDSTQLKGIYRLGGGSKKRYHIPPTFFDLFKILFAQRMFYTKLNSDSDGDAHGGARHEIRIQYRTPLIQSGVKGRQYSWKLPQIKDPSGVLPTFSLAALGKNTWDSDSLSSQQIQANSLIDMPSFFENLAKLLCYTYEIGHATSQDDNAHWFSWKTPNSWNTHDCSETGIHTNSWMGEKYKALFGGHLYYALQYYKEGLTFIQQLDAGAQFEIIGSDTLPTPLDIFTKDKNGKSNLITPDDLAVEADISEELVELSTKPLTDFADIHYGLRLSYLMPKNESQFNDIWEKIKAPFTLDPPTTAGDQLPSELLKSRTDFFQNSRRQKAIFMKEGPDVITADQADNNVILIPLLKEEIPVLHTTIKPIADNFNINKVTSLWSSIKKKDDFRLLFEYIFPLQRMLAMLIIRDTLNFDMSTQELDESYVKLLRNENVFGKTKKHLYTLINLAIETSNDPSLVHLASKNMEQLLGEMDMEITADELQAFLSMDKPPGTPPDE